MADTYNEYTADGSTSQFTVGFDYIRKSHVVALVNGSTVTYTWANDSLVELDVTPDNGDTVKIMRSTPKSLLVDYQNGSLLNERNLEVLAKQCLFVAQEMTAEMNADYSPIGHTHDTRYYTESEVDSQMSGKADTGHNHDGDYATAGHTHDGRYYTETEVDSQMSGKADTGHAHTEADVADLDKYTQAQTDSLLSGKSDTGHGHVEADITDLDKYTQAQTDSLLSGKSDTGHAHDPSELGQEGASDQDALVWNGTSGQWEPKSGVVAYSDQDAVDAVNADTDHGSTAQHDYYTDVQAKAAVVSTTITDGVTDKAPSEDTVEAALAGKSDTGHTHDDRYYTETEMDNLLENAGGVSGKVTKAGSFFTENRENLMELKDATGDSMFLLPVLGSGNDFSEWSFLNSSAYRLRIKPNFLEFDGTNKYTMPPDSRWNVLGDQTGEKTISCYVKFDATGFNERILTLFDSIDNLFRFYKRDTDIINLYTKVNGSGEVNITSSTVLSADTWYHVALVVKDSIVGLYINGTQEHSKDSFLSHNLASTELIIGSDESNNFPMSGNIQDLQIVHSNPFGANPNTSNNDSFTAPSRSTIPSVWNSGTGYGIDLPNKGSAVTLLYDHANAHYSIKERAGQVNIEGLVLSEPMNRIDLWEPGATGYAVKQDKTGRNSCFIVNDIDQLLNGKFKSDCWNFPGNDEYAYYLDSSDWNIFGDKVGCKTVEFWVYHNATGGERILGQYEDSNNRWSFYKDTSDNYHFVYVANGTTHFNISSSAISLTSWFHVMVVIKGSAIGLYIDGTQVADTATWSADTFSGSLYVGQFGESTIFFNGRMQHLHISYNNPYNADPQSDSSDSVAIPDGPPNYVMGA